MGEIDLVHALALAAIRSAVFIDPGNPARYSRWTAHVLDWVDTWLHPETAVEALLRFGRAQPVPPVLFYDGDWDLLLVSRHRDELRPTFSFVVADAELVEDLVDKRRFQALAERLELPVPRGRRVPPGGNPSDVDLRFPVVAKPLTRQRATWSPLTAAKAMRAEHPKGLRDLVEAARSAGVELLVQEEVPGPESRIASYHVYVDEAGETVAEFTGRKLRTYPAGYGYTTSLEITDDPDTARLGRELTERLALRGVAKFDFKRDDDGRLHLLEINPRFNLWHHAGAIAGVNLPGFVYADLAGRPRPPARSARAGVRWCSVRHDLPAARQAGLNLHRWLASLARSDVTSGFSWKDPLPLPRALIWRARGRVRNGIPAIDSAGSLDPPRFVETAALRKTPGFKRRSIESSDCPAARKVTAVVTDVDFRGPLNAVRALGRAGIPVVALAPHLGAAGVWSRYAAHRAIGPRPDADPEGFIARLSAIARARGDVVVYPGTEAAIDALLATPLPPEVVLPYPSLSILRALRDKSRLVTLAERAGLRTPVALATGPAGEIREADIRTPCVVKKALPEHGKFHHPIVRTTEQLRALLKDVPPDHQLVVQEFLDGPVTSLSLVVARGGEIAARFQQVAGRARPPGAGTTSLSASIAPDEDLVARLAAMLHAAGYWGFAQLQFLDADRRPALIDVNPRFYGTLSLANACGVNLPAIWHTVVVGETLPSPPPYRTGVTYRYLENDVKSVLEGSPRRLLRPAPRPVTGAAWASDDPLAAAVLAAHGVGGAAWRGLRGRA